MKTNPLMRIKHIWLQELFPLYIGNRPRTVLLIVASLLFSIISSLGSHYRPGDTIENIISHFNAPGLIIFYFIFSTVFVFVLGTVLIKLWEQPQGKAFPITKKRLAMFALLLLVLWLPWLIIHYPGTMRDDTLPQLFQWFGQYPYYTQHPITDTVIFGAFFSLGDLFGNRSLGLFLYLVIQALLTATIFSLIICYLRAHGAPRILVVLIVLFYGFSRVIYQPIDSMSKDALNGIFFAVCTLCFVEAVRSQGKVLKKPWFSIGFMLAIFLCVATKRTMFYVLLIAFLVYILFLALRKQRIIAPALILFAPALISLFVWLPFLSNAFNAVNSQTYEMYSIPVQQLVKTTIDHPDALTEEENEILATFIDIEKAQTVYNPNRSDEATGCIIDKNAFRQCIGLWLSAGFKCPDSYAKAFISLTANWFGLTNSIDYGHNSHEELLNESRMKQWRTFFATDQQMNDFFSTIELDHSDSLLPAVKVSETIDHLQTKLPVLSSYGLYCVVFPLLFLVYALTQQKNRELICIAALPCALILSFLVGPIALYWYTIPMTYIVPLLMGVPFVFKSSQD